MIYTARTLARRWQCTPQHVYNLKAQGTLQGFKLGGKLWRITEEEVARCETTGSDASKEDGLSFGRKMESDTAGGLLAQRQRQKRELRLQTSPATTKHSHAQKE